MTKPLYFHQTVKEIGFDNRGAFVILDVHIRTGEEDEKKPITRFRGCTNTEIKLYLEGSL